MSRAASEFAILAPGDYQYCNLAAPELPEYRLKNPQSLDQILLLRQKLADQNPGSFIFLSYDRVGQACYTSMHCCQNHDLDGTEYDDEGNVSVLQEFSDRLKKYNALVSQASFEKSCKFGLYLPPPEFEEWEKLQSDPFAGFDNWVEFVVVPGETPIHALAACPNGYFTSDWGPPEIYGVVDHFRRNYAYEIMAIGASYLLLERNEPASPETAKRIAQDFMALYNVEANGCSFSVETVASRIAGSLILCHKYTE